MVVWQFTTIAALIGALLIYVIVLTNRLGTTNALLKRIEEGLVRPQPVTENLPAAAAEVDEASAAELPERERRVSYLTVRDLKVIARSGRRSSDIPVGGSPLFNEVFGSRNAPAALVESPVEAALPQFEVVAVDEPMVAGVDSPAVVADLAAATYEVRDFLDTTLSPANPLVEAEPVVTEPLAADFVACEPATTGTVAFGPAVPQTATPEPMEMLHAAVLVSEAAVDPSPPAPDITAANEDQAPAEPATAAAKESEPDDAAAREEKRKRDLLMHAYRRRRAR